MYIFFCSNLVDLDYSDGTAVLLYNCDYAMFFSGFGGLGHVINRIIQRLLSPRHRSVNSGLDKHCKSTEWMLSLSVPLTREFSSSAVCSNFIRS